MHYRIRHLVRCVLFLSIALFVNTFAGLAQDEEPNQLWSVYIERDSTGSGVDRLIFEDVLTGETNTAQVIGERYTLLDDRVIYFDTNNRSVMSVSPQGTVSPHAIIQLGDALRVDWAVSADYHKIAWTQTYQDGEGLRTVTQIASPDGAGLREVYADGPRSDGLRAFPVTFNADNSALIMDFHPHLIGGLAPYRLYAGLFRVSFSDSSISPLPDDETPCFCSAALQQGRFLRLSVTPDLTGFDMLMFELTSGDVTKIPAISLRGFTQAGDILVSPDARQAVYALSEIENFGTPEQAIRTIFMLVDFETQTQRQLTEPVTRYVHPLKWTEDNSAVIVTSAARNGTWKIHLADGSVTKVAEATYIGMLQT